MALSREEGLDDEADERLRQSKTFRVAFIHPDLGIGGAERLVVDAAVGLQELGHEADIITSHHDSSHCFEPTRDGTLNVFVAKTLFPRHVRGMFHLPLAIARQVSLLFQLLIALLAFRFPGSIPTFAYSRLTSFRPLQEYDVFVVDQLSAIVPFLRIFTATRVIFYCHFPDKDVGSSIARQKAIERGQSGPGIIRALYRIPFDLLEEMTMGASDKILVNSEFTSQQFQRSFFRLARIPRVVYPGIDPRESTKEHVSEAVTRLKEKIKGERDEVGVTSVREAIHKFVEQNDRPTLISINRFEAKKNVALAVDTFVQVQKQFAALGQTQEKLRLVLAGGYDYRVQDNIMTLKELQAQCEKHGLSHLTLFYNGAGLHEPPASAPRERELMNASVVFLPSVPYALLTSMLMHASTRALLYTPTEEHFGIVPLEAMVVGLPVLATNSGGPMESVVDLRVEDEQDAIATGAATGSRTGGLRFSNPNGTGLLRRATPKLWSQAAMNLLALSEAQRTQIAHNARARVQEKFSRASMSKEFERCLWELERMGAVRAEEGLLQWGIATGMFCLMSLAFVILLYYANGKQQVYLRTIQQAKAHLESVQGEIEELKRLKEAGEYGRRA